MDGFGWAENNLDVRTSEELEQRGLTVAVAPNVRPAEIFEWANCRPQRAFYMVARNLDQHCLEHGLRLLQTNRQVSLSTAT